MKVVWGMKIVLGMEVVWGMKTVWGMKAGWGMKAVWEMEVEWVMEVSLGMEVEQVVGVVWDGDELVHAEQEVQHRASVLHVCRCTVTHQSERPPPNEAPNIT